MRYTHKHTLIAIRIRKEHIYTHREWKETTTITITAQNIFIQAEMWNKTRRLNETRSRSFLLFCVLKWFQLFSFWWKRADQLYKMHMCNKINLFLWFWKTRSVWARVYAFVSARVCACIVGLLLLCAPEVHRRRRTKTKTTAVKATTTSSIHGVHSLARYFYAIVNFKGIFIHDKNRLNGFKKPTQSMHSHKHRHRHRQWLTIWLKMLPKHN